MEWTKEREEFGKLVRQVWIAWAMEQPNPKPSWLVPWESLSEPDKEVDRRIGEALATRALELAAARGGTMTETDLLKAWLELRDTIELEPHDLRAQDHALVQRLRSHVNALGARNAVLEASEKVWRQRVEKAADLLVDVLPGEVGRIDLVARIRALRAERDDLSLRLTALEVAGAKLSAHVDKTAGQEISEEAVEALTRRNEVEDAMRAACILIVDEEMMTAGISGSELHGRIKGRVKGAAT